MRLARPLPAAADVTRAQQRGKLRARCDRIAAGVPSPGIARGAPLRATRARNTPLRFGLRAVRRVWHAA
jgi:hypothetical protein